MHHLSATLRLASIVPNPSTNRSGTLQDMDSCFVTLLVILLALAWVFALIQMVIAGDLTIAEGTVGSLIALLLAFGTARALVPHIGIVSLVTLGGGAIAFPLLRYYINQKLHAQIDAERMEQACQAYEFDPKNYGSLLQLAQICYRYNLLEHAVFYLEKAIQTAPLMTTTEKRRLQMWQEDLQQSKPLGYAICMHCGARNSIGALRCTNCNNYILPSLVAGRTVPRQLLQKAILSWMIATAGIVMVLVLRASLIGGAALGAIVLTVLLTLVALFWVIRKV